jgi:hypothetical protein
MASPALQTWLCYTLKLRLGERYAGATNISCAGLWSPKAPWCKRLPALLLGSAAAAALLLLLLCAGPSGSLPKALAELVRPAAVAAFQEAMASVLTSGAVAKKKQKEAALKTLEETFLLLQLYANGSELLQVRFCLCG